MAAATAQAAPATAQNLSGVAGDLYANSFAASDPRSVHSLLTNRLKRGEQFNDDLAEYFRQRNLIEDAYVKSLLRLARKPITTIGSGPGALPGEELGDVATRIQELLERELNEVATSHTVFQRRMLQEVEAPLKSAVTKGAWANTKTYDSNLLSTIKDLEEAEARHAKSKAKVDSAGGSKKLGQLQQKAGEDSRHLAIVRETYLTESPFALQHFQTVDQERLAFLNEAAARFETIQSDHAREVMEIAEKGMLQILSSDPREEMQEFAVKYGNANAALGLSPGGTRRARGGSRTNGVVSARVPDSERMPPPPVPNITTPTSAVPPPIRRQASVHSRQSASDTPSIRSGGGGLKGRLGGFLNRNNRNSQMPLPRAPEPSGQQGDDSLAEQSFSTIHAPSTVGAGDDEMGGGGGLAASTGTANRRSSFIPGMLARRKTSKSAPTSPPPDLRTDVAAPPMPDAPSPPGPGRPTGYEMNQRDALNAINEDRARDGPLPPMPGFGGDNAPAAPAPTVSMSAPPLEPKKIDAEGFTVPPADRERPPWEAAGGGTTSLLDDDEEAAPVGSSTAAPAVSPFAIQPVAQSETSSAEQDAALQRVRSTLLSGGPARRSTGARGRRDRMSTLNPTAAIPDDMPLGEAAKHRQSSIGFPTPPGSAKASSPFTASPPMSPFAPLPVQTTGTSVVSTSSSQANLAAQAANPFASGATPTTTGARASVTETVNVLIKAGVVQRAMVTGEIALFLSTGAAGLRFRLVGADRFEKLVANPALVDSSSGEYVVRPGLKEGTSQVVIKYQLRLSEAEAKAFVPLEVTPQWRNEASQTSMMLTYQPNASCALLASTPSLDSPFADSTASIRLEQVSFVAHVNCDVSTVQSRPEGEWDPSTKKMTWRFDSLDGGPGKILTRFLHGAQDSLNVPSPVTVRWLVKGTVGSGIGVEMVGTEGQAFEDVARTTVSGRYLAA